MAKYTDLCNQILENVGGKENVSQAVHCMTRLRLNLKDRSQVDMDAVKGIKGWKACLQYKYNFKSLS